ncbi:meiosis 1 arrest protein isoform X5 [Sceloporus undulatus]|uniref:meiosis 1 arrest protein isoform X5 n=1 Tax=Sceloporus undulatus TaxID=8520 RepID=UPI001C4D30E9|nr:meiosis 1 arrest protein isoform X5 [Sceloporus undulatus]
MMSSGTKRMRDAGATDLGSQPATGSQPPPPPRILVVDARPPHWAQTCPKLCEALENLFCLACSLGGPPRLPLFSLYVAQRQHECLLPFMPVKGGFARLQSCLAELRAVPAEGAFRPGEEAAAVAQAVQDGLQQFKQYTGQGMAGATLSSCAIEVTVLTSQLSTEVARQLEMRLQGTDQVSLRQLQVVAIAPGGLQEVPTPAAGGSTSTHGTPVEEEACLKCDIQERLLSPALLPPVGTNRDNVARANSVTTDCFWMAPGPGLAPHRLRVLRYPSGALRAEGLCASLLFGLPLIVRPTSCWRLNWDELEVNQHRFQALCRGLRNREWLLLARHEPQGESGPCRVPLATAPVASHWALLPAASCSSLLLRALAPQELLLPGPCPVLPADPPEAALRDMEGILEGLEVEMTFDPLCLGSHLYRALRTILARPLDPRPPLRLAERHLSRQQASRQHPSRARATVAPLRLAPAGPNASRVALSLFSGEEEEFLDAI